MNEVPAELDWQPWEIEEAELRAEQKFMKTQNQVTPPPQIAADKPKKSFVRVEIGTEVEFIQENARFRGRVMDIADGCAAVASIGHRFMMYIPKAALIPVPNGSGVIATMGQIIRAFTEWDRRYRQEPERFMSEAEHLLKETPESYGEACAPYFVKILGEV